MDTIYDITCGLDVHKNSVVACIVKTDTNLKKGDNNEKVELVKGTFTTFSEGLNELKDWIVANDCHRVAMESTGVYWHPVYDALEDAFDGDIEILVCNPRNMHNVRGKKTDMNDAEWIGRLLRSGMLAGGFIPPLVIRELRERTRYRKCIVEDISTQKNRIEKTLQSAGFKLSTFLSDIFGVSGRNIIDVLIQNGCLAKNDVDILTKSIKADKKMEMKRLLTNKLSASNQEMLKTKVEHLDELLSHLKKVEALIEEITIQYEAEIKNLDTVPGISETSAKAIIAEIGVDMSKFKTAEHLCSWAGLSPGNNESAGKKKSTRTTLGNPYIKSLLVECAWTITRMRDCHLNGVYYRIRNKRGSKKAVVAVARKMLVIIYHLLKDNTVYDDKKYEMCKQKVEILELKRLYTLAKKKGYKLVPIDQNLSSSLV